MVTKGVSKGVAFMAGVGSAVDCHSQPVPQAAAILLIMDGTPFSQWGSAEERARPQSWEEDADDRRWPR